MDDKLNKIKTLKEQRKTIDDEIKTLTVELTAEMTAALHGDRKARKPRAPKQLSLVK